MTEPLKSPEMSWRLLLMVVLGAVMYSIATGWAQFATAIPLTRFNSPTQISADFAVALGLVWTLLRLRENRGQVYVRNTWLMAIGAMLLLAAVQATDWLVSVRFLDDDGWVDIPLWLGVTLLLRQMLHRQHADRWVRGIWCASLLLQIVFILCDLGDGRYVAPWLMPFSSVAALTEWTEKLAIGSNILILVLLGVLSPGRVDSPQARAERAKTGRQEHSPYFRWKIRVQVERASRDQVWHASELAAFEASLTGTAPRARQGGILLAACDSDYYVRFAPALLLSLQRLGAGDCVHLHLYRPTADVLRHVEHLRRRLTAIDLSWTVDPCVLATGMRHPAVYFTSARFMLAERLLRQHRRPVLCIDIDGIAVREIWPAYAASIALGDVGLISRPSARRASRKILASAVGFNPTREGLRFGSTVARSLAGLYSGQPLYHLDQIVLHYAVLEERRRGPFQLFDMPPGLADHAFGEDAVLWTAKGWRNKNSEHFAAAKQEAEALAPDLAVVRP